MVGEIQINKNQINGKIINQIRVGEIQINKNHQEVGGMIIKKNLMKEAGEIMIIKI